MKYALKKALSAITYGSLLAILIFLLLFLSSCADSDTIKIDQRQDVYNTYVTQLLEEYYVTNVTEQYITQEYYDVTNIEGAQVEIVPICPEIDGDYPEVLLKIDGTLVAYFAENGDAKRSRLVVVPENTVLKTTDLRDALFKIEDGQIVCLGTDKKGK